MKEEDLEKYIRGHKEEFDTDLPPPTVWINIEKELKKYSAPKPKIYPIKKPSIVRILQVAAMFIVVIGAGLLIGVKINKKKQYSTTQFQDLVDAEKYYSKKITKIWMAISENKIEDKNSIKEDLIALDAVHDELRNGLLASPNSNTELIVNAMLKNYNAKIEILETVLIKHNKNQEVNINDDKVEL